MTKRNYLERKKYFSKFSMTEEEAVIKTVKELLGNLYIPCEDNRADHGIDFVADPVKVKKWNLDGDAINWGDLSAIEAHEEDGVYVVTVQEVAPKSVNLIRYLEFFMNKWGWNVRIETEW